MIENDRGSKGLHNELRKLNIYSKANKRSLPEHLQYVNDINKHFITSSQSLDSPDPEILDLLTNNEHQNIGNIFNFAVVDESTVRKVLYNVKSNGVGTDNIGRSMLLLSCPHILKYITHIAPEQFGNHR